MFAGVLSATCSLGSWLLCRRSLLLGLWGPVSAHPTTKGSRSGFHECSSCWLAAMLVMLVLPHHNLPSDTASTQPPLTR